MTAQNRTVNKSRFEQGDTPQGSDYVDLIDSYLSLADTTAQSLSSPLTMAGSLGVSATASASTLEVLGIIHVSGAATFDGHVSAKSLTVTGDVTAAAFYASAATLDEIIASAGTFTFVSAANLSANAVGITGSLTWTAEVTASTVSTGTQTLPAVAAGFLVATVCGQTVGVPYFKVA
jgi:hypothetical protein